jgi:hypothetical protein
MEAIMAAGAIKPQEMVAQQRQFFLLAQRPDAAVGERRTVDIVVAHV